MLVASVALLAHSASGALQSPPGDQAVAPATHETSAPTRVTAYDRAARDVDLKRLAELPDPTLKPGYTRVGANWLRVAQHLQTLSAADQDVLFAEHMGRNSLYTADERITLLLSIAFVQDTTALPVPFHSLIVRPDAMWVAPRAGSDVTLASQIRTFWNLRNDAIGFARHVRAASGPRNLEPFLAAASKEAQRPSDVPTTPPPVRYEEVRTDVARGLWMHPGTLISILKHLPSEAFDRETYRPSPEHLAVARLLSALAPRDVEVMFALYSGARRADAQSRMRCAILTTLIYDTETDGPADGPSLVLRLSRDRDGNPLLIRRDSSGEERPSTGGRQMPDPVDYVRAVSATHPVRTRGSLPFDASLDGWTAVERACSKAARHE